MVLQQEPAHVEREGSAKAGHLILWNAHRAMGAWAQKPEYTRQALFFFGCDLAARAQEYQHFTPFRRVVGRGHWRARSHVGGNVPRQRLQRDAGIHERRVVVGRSRAKG